MIELSVLVEAGDMKITWDPAKPEEVEQARATILDLKAKGFSFFLSDGVTPADEIAAGQGTLSVRRVEVEELLTGGGVASTTKTAQGRRGPRIEGSAAQEGAVTTTQQAVAVPAQRGG